tara:strand:- start:243 stop:395 length:153 start_codon:yes stop_codon:yes gene_type:complete
MAGIRKKPKRYPNGLADEEWSMTDRERAGREASPSAPAVDRKSVKAPART